MKVICLNASYKGKNKFGSKFGKTYATINAVLEKITEQLEEEVEYEIIPLSEADMNVCIGCAKCFRKNKCSFDDDYNIIMKKLFTADVIIFASPVYAFNVSISMKCFIERASQVMHRRGLYGKLGVAISTSLMLEGSIYVNYYLTNIMRNMGIAVAGSVSTYGVMYTSHENQETVQQVEDCVTKLLWAYKENINIYEEPEFGMNFKDVIKECPEQIKRLFAKDYEYFRMDENYEKSNLPNADGN